MAVPKVQLNKDSEFDLFLELIEILTPLDLAAVANEAGVCYGTLWQWLYGSTTKPRLDTLVKVAGAVGYDLVLVRSAPKTKRRSHLKVVR